MVVVGTDLTDVGVGSDLFAEVSSRTAEIVKRLGPTTETSQSNRPYEGLPKAPRAYRGHPVEYS